MIFTKEDGEVTCLPKTGPVVVLDLYETLGTDVAKKKSFSSAMVLQKDLVLKCSITRGRS